MNWTVESIESEETDLIAPPKTTVKQAVNDPKDSPRIIVEHDITNEEKR